MATNLLKNNKYLMLLFWLVILSQIAATLLEYEVNSSLARLYTDLDQRTSVMSSIEAAINSLSFIMQFLASAIFKSLGVGYVLKIIPMILFTAIISFSIFNQLSIIAATRIIGKAFDYSLPNDKRHFIYSSFTS